MRTVLAIDDSGLPGAETHSKHLNPNRKTWLGVYISGDSRSEFEPILQNALIKLQCELGIEEFHFTDIYSGAGAYEGMPFENRMALFNAFTTVYNEYKWPVFVQTLHPDSDIERGLIIQIQSRPDGFNHMDFGERALYQMLLKFGQFRATFKLTEPFQVQIDQGLQKAGSSRMTPGLNEFIQISQLDFLDSKDSLCLQMADFLAITLNRSQMIMVKPNKTDADIEFLQTVSRLEIDSSDIHRFKQNPYEFTKDDFDYYHHLLKNNQGFLTKSEVDEIKRKLGRQ